MIKIKRSNPRAQVAPPRPSRIRRDPVAPGAVPKAVNPYPTEREVWIVVLGVILFALAIAIIIFAISDYTSH